MVVEALAQKLEYLTEEDLSSKWEEAKNRGATLLLVFQEFSRAGNVIDEYTRSVADPDDISKVRRVISYAENSATSTSLLKAYRFENSETSDAVAGQVMDGILKSKINVSFDA